jgi:hypothetical protein
MYCWSELILKSKTHPAIANLNLCCHPKKQQINWLTLTWHPRQQQINWLTLKTVIQETTTNRCLYSPNSEKTMKIHHQWEKPWKYIPSEKNQENTSTVRKTMKIHQSEKNHVFSFSVTKIIKTCINYVSPASKEASLLMISYLLQKLNVWH